MDQHQRDEWRELVIFAFSSDADVNVNPYADDFEAEASWPIPTAECPNKRSKTVNLVISQEAVRDWLEKDESRRERDKQKVEKWIRNKLESFDDGHEVPRDQPPPQVDWIIGTEVLNS